MQIIADDLGLHRSINEGIVELLKTGRINGASLMANGGAFEDAVEKIKNLPSVNIGIHFVLVEEKPLVLKKLSQNHKIFFVKYVLGLIKLSDIEKELRAQLGKVVDMEIKPAFINSHQHLHLLPGIADKVIKLAKEFKIPYIRIVVEPVTLGNDRLFRQAQLLFLNFLSWLAKNKVKRAGLECNDYFVGFVNAGNLTNADINFAKELSHKFPDKVVELGCHPGYEDENLRNKYRHWGRYHWQKEIEVLKNIK